MKERNLSIEDLSSRAGITRGGFDYARKNKSLKLAMLLKFAEILNVSPSYFFEIEPGTIETFPFFTIDKDDINSYKKLIASLESDLQTKRKYIELLEKECKRKEEELEKLKKNYPKGEDSDLMLKVRES